MASRKAEGARVVLVRAVVVLWLAGGAQSFIGKPPTAGSRPPEMWMSTTELVRRRGYLVETHEVLTADGYILQLHRIPPANQSLHGTPVLFGHGLASNDEQWLLRDEDNLTFLLVDLGFDIWLGNYRGSFYSRRHADVSPQHHQFWNFSFHENGVYDQAAMIDHILARTHRPALITLGHSLGCTAQLVLLSERPEYCDKVLANVLLAPPTNYMTRSSLGDVIKSLVKHYPKSKFATDKADGNTESVILANPVPLLCYPAHRKPINPLCLVFVEVYMGATDQPLNEKLLEKHIAHWPAGASTRQVTHYVQINDAGPFLKYDFGLEKNVRIYGSLQPPAYNLSQITSPSYLYYSATDNCVPYQDAEFLGQHLPNCKTHKIQRNEFNHLDFLISNHVYEAVYKHVIRDMLMHVSHEIP